MKKTFAVLLTVAIILVIGFPIFFSATPVGKAVWNSWFYTVQKSDDATKYQTKRTVEDTCRAMISSYDSDKLVYEQYKGSKDKDEKSWGEQAKMRANRTASTYNNYMLKNSFIWQGNVPVDIFETLGYIE